MESTSALQNLLHTALRDAMDELTGAGVAVYFLEEGGEALGTVMMAGSPPAVLVMDDRVGLDLPCASAEAFRENDVVVHGQEDARRAGRFPYSVMAAPLSSGTHRFGVLTVLCAPAPGAPTAAGAQWLRRRCVRLADELAALAAAGVRTRPSSRPVLLPMYPAHSRDTAATGDWGMPEVRQSVGITQMYQVRRLTEDLHRALTAKDVALAAETHMMVPFGGQELTLSVVDRGRLWVIGHGGRVSEGSRHLNGSSINEKTPVSEALLGRPLFLDDSGSRSALFPNVPDAGAASWAYLPLRSGSRQVGVCSVSFSEPRRLTPDERAVMGMMVEMIGTALERVRMNESNQTLAQNLQRRLLPRMLSHFPEVTVAARYLPAAPPLDSGGDWYDVVRLPDRRIAFIIGDVEGHGVESSAVMGQVRTAILAYASEGHPPAAIMERAGNLLTTLGTELLATCCVVCLDVSTGALEVCLAGHPPPVVRRPHGGVEPLEACAGLPLGIGGTTFGPSSITELAPGSLLLLYTNGLAGGGHRDPAADAGELLTSLGEGALYNIEKSADDLVVGLPDSAARPDDTALLLAHYEGVHPGTRRRTDRMEIQRRDLRGVGEARTFVRHRLNCWGLDSVADELEIIVSELATNALIHADSDVELRLREYGDRVRLEVRDSDSTPPAFSLTRTPEDNNDEAESGRGLLIVNALTSAFGSSPNGRGKTVWLEVPTGRSAPAPQDTPDGR